MKYIKASGVIIRISCTHASFAFNWYHSLLAAPVAPSLLTDGVVSWRGSSYLPRVVFDTMMCADFYPILFDIFTFLRLHQLCPCLCRCSSGVTRGKYQVQFNFTLPTSMAASCASSCPIFISPNVFLFLVMRLSFFKKVRILDSFTCPSSRSDY